MERLLRDRAWDGKSFDCSLILTYLGLFLCDTLRGIVCSESIIDETIKARSIKSREADVFLVIG